MIDKRFEKIIKIINEKMTKNKIKWALIGSTNMAVQEINVNPRDLDIVVTLEDLRKMHKIFSEYDPSKISELKPFVEEPAWEVKVIIDTVEVQILGENSAGEYVSKLLANRLIKIKIGDFEVPCFTLDAEAQTYAETNRAHKAEIIRGFLKEKQK